MSAAATQTTPPPETTPFPRLGKYELVSRIGQGGMAEVYLARMRGPMDFEKLLVIKTIHPELSSQEEFLRMLLDEARLSALIRHPNVVDIYELGQAQSGDYFIAMEYLDGQPFSALLAAGAQGAPLDPMCVARVVADAAAGLHAAHELRSASGKHYQLVHRDVSPGNVMVLYNGNAKIVDFGVAKARGRLTSSGAHTLKGKIGYAAPEQLTGAPVDRRADVFSLGVVLWEALTLRRLYPGNELETAEKRARGGVIPPPSVFAPHVPPQLDEVCEKALVDDPERRYPTAAAMQADLERALRELGTHREREQISEHMARVFQRRREERSQLLRPRRPTQSEMALPDLAVGSTPQLKLPTPPAQSASGPTLVTRRRWPLVAGVGAVLAVAALMLWPQRHASEVPAAVAASEPPPPLPPPAPVEPAAAPVEAEPPPVVAPPAPTPEVVADEPEEDPKSKKTAAELHREGADLFLRGKANEAKSRFKQAIARDPRHAPSYRGLGLAYQALGQDKKALAAFEKYLALNPAAADASSVRARMEKLRR